MNKKGGILDLFFFAVIIVITAIFLLILGKVVGDITGELQNSTMNQSEKALYAFNYSESLTTQFNYIFLVIFFWLLLFVLISSALISVNKIFVPIYIILFAMAIVIGVIMNNVYEEFRESTLLSSTATAHPFANAIIGNYILVLIGVGVLSMILIFGKTGRESQRL